MTVSEKFKTINNTIEQNVAQCDLYRYTTGISASPSGNVGKFEFLTSEDVLAKKRLARETCYNQMI